MSNGKYIAKTPKMILTNIRNSGEVVVTLCTVSVKKRGGLWSESETHTGLDGRGPTKAEAEKDLYDYWNQICMEKYGETIFIEKADDRFEVLTQ